MGWSDAEPVSAQMIQLKPIGNRADRQLIRDPMRDEVPSADADAPVATPTLGTRPSPAAALSLVHLGPEQVNRRAFGQWHWTIAAPGRQVVLLAQAPGLGIPVAVVSNAGTTGVVDLAGGYGDPAEGFHRRRHPRRGPASRRRRSR